MDSESSAFGAANTKHHRYMVFGKKQRYIEVFQCSGEDMSVVLTGGANKQQQQQPQQPPLLSPGMLPTPVVSQQYDMLPLGVSNLTNVQQGLGLGMPQLLAPQTRPAADLNMLQLLQVPGLGLGLPAATSPLVMLPRPGMTFQPTLQLPGVLPQQRYPSLLPTPGASMLTHLPAGNKRSHGQAFAETAGGYTGTLPPKRPPVMYTTQQGGIPPPGAPGLLPTPTTMYGNQTQATNVTAAAYPTI